MKMKTLWAIFVFCTSLVVVEGGDDDLVITNAFISKKSVYAEAKDNVEKSLSSSITILQKRDERYLYVKGYSKNEITDDKSGNYIFWL